MALGYTSDFGNMTPSDHGWTVGGDAELSGSYHNPNFLSYNGMFYLNQSRANSDFQSISDASGVNLSANIFGGSKFPGAINYSKAFNSEGNYAVPGLANYVTKGNNSSFGVNWSENIPNKPSFSVGAQIGSSQYSVYGANDQGTNAFHSINLHSGYRFAGFNMGGFYSTGGSHSLIPGVVTGGEDTDMSAESGALGFNVSHMLPLNGSFSASLNRSNYSSGYLTSSTNGTIDLVNTLVTVRPVRKLSLSFSADYSDNLAGQLDESVVSAGGVLAGTTNSASDSVDLLGIATYAVDDTAQTSLYIERRSESYGGQELGITSYGGSASYAHHLFGGNFNASVNATGNVADSNGQDTLGFSDTENYSGLIKDWHVTGSFSYAQNVETLLITYLNSYYNFSVNANRNWRKFRVGFGAGAAHTGLTDAPNTASSSQNYNASLGYNGYFNVTGAYSKASGEALITGGGLVPVPIPSPVLPSSLVSLYGGDSYSVGVSSTPIRRLIMAATWAKSISNSNSSSILTNDDTSEANAIFQYQFRKLSLNSGYSRLQQGFSSSTSSQPEVISSFYIGVSRWFNFF